MTWNVFRASESVLLLGSSLTSVRVNAYLGASLQFASVTFMDRDIISSPLGEDPNAAIDASPKTKPRIPIRALQGHASCQHLTACKRRSAPRDKHLFHMDFQTIGRVVP
jgi:hypothetical protein